MPKPRAPRRAQPQKPELADAFRDRLRKADLTARQAAERLGVVDATLRTWLARNSFPKAAAVALARLLGWKVTADAMLDRYAVRGNKWARGPGELPGVGTGPPSCARLFTLFDRKARRVARVMNAAAADFSLLYQSLSDGDLCVTSTASVTPPEMGKAADQVLIERIAAGVARGGRFLYLRPGEGHLTDLMHKFDHGMQDANGMTTELNRLRDEVRKRLVADPARARLAGRADTHVLQRRCPPGVVAFLVPGFVIRAFQTFGPSSNTSRRIAVLLPREFGGPIYLSNEYNEAFVGRFVRFAHAAVCDWKPEPAADAAAVEAVRRILESKPPQA